MTRSHVWRAERGQNTLEYLLIIGLIVAAMMAILLIGLPVIVQQVAGHLCPAIDTAKDLTPPATPGSCLVLN